MLNDFVCCFDASSPESVINYGDSDPITLYDCSGYENHATIKNNKFNLLTKNGAYCWYNNGDSNGYMISANYDLTTSNWTMVLWLYPDVQNNLHNKFFVQKDYIKLALSNDNSTFTQLHFYDDEWSETKCLLSIGEWNFVSLECNNGHYNVRTLSSTLGYYIYNKISSVNRKGNIFIGGDYSDNNNYTGGIGLFYLWNKVLTENELYQVLLHSNYRFGLSLEWT